MRLGMPGSGASATACQSASYSVSENFVTTPRSVRRQEATSAVASTRSHATSVKARAPPGSSSGHRGDEAVARRRGRCGGRRSAGRSTGAGVAADGHRRRAGRGRRGSCRPAATAYAVTPATTTKHEGDEHGDAAAAGSSRPPRSRRRGAAPRAARPGARRSRAAPTSDQRDLRAEQEPEHAEAGGRGHPGERHHGLRRGDPAGPHRRAAPAGRRARR